MITKFRLTILIAIGILASIISCAPKKSIPSSLVRVKAVVSKLDSAVTSMYGWEPRDSTYNKSIDTLVANILSDYAANNPEIEPSEENNYAIQQQAYDEARITWEQFKRLCYEDKYEEALNVYLGERDDQIKKNSGNFIIFLKHSTHRFVFYSQVLLPMMKEIKGDSFAIDEYISLLQLEKAEEDLAISMNAGITDYVPEVYPSVIEELGSALVSVGKMHEAQDMFNDYTNAIYLQTNDALYAIFAGKYYATHLFLQGHKRESALNTWNNFKDYLEENKHNYDPEELAICLKRIDEQISDITSNTIGNPFHFSH